MRSNLYKSPWARQYNPLRRRQGESYRGHEDRLARYAVVLIVIIGLSLMAWTAKGVPMDSPHNSAGAIRHQAGKILEGLHE